MQYVGRLVSSVYNTITPSINPATLSGAIDVIVVEREVQQQVPVPDEELEAAILARVQHGLEERPTKTVTTTELASTPFHVRFGKMSVLRPAERKVTLHLNNASSALPFPMKIGTEGEAFFVVELDDPNFQEQIPADLVTSPILSAASSPAHSPDTRPIDSASGETDEGPMSGHAAGLSSGTETPTDMEPLDLGESRIGADVGTETDVASSAPTLRSSSSTASTNLTSPSLGANPMSETDAEAAMKTVQFSPEGGDITASKSRSGEAHTMDKLGKAAARAGLALGSTGRALAAPLGATGLAHDRKLESVANAAQDNNGGGAPVDQGKQLASRFHSEAGHREDMHGSGPADGSKSNTEILEEDIRDRTLTQLSTEDSQTDALRSDVSIAASQAHQAEEEQYPKPFGNQTDVQDTERRQIEAAEQTVSENVADPTSSRDKSENSPTSTSKGLAADQGNLESPHGSPEQIRRPVIDNKDDLQYMFDMDGYKMTADGEDLAFQEGHRLAGEVPTSRRHGGNGRRRIAADRTDRSRPQNVTDVTGSREFAVHRKAPPRRRSKTRQRAITGARPPAAPDRVATLKRTASMSSLGVEDSDSDYTSDEEMAPDVTGIGLTAAAALSTGTDQTGLKLSRDLMRLARITSAESAPDQSLMEELEALSGGETRKEPFPAQRRRTKSGKSQSSRAARSAHFQEASVSDTEAEIIHQYTRARRNRRQAGSYATPGRQRVDSTSALHRRTKSSFAYAADELHSVHETSVREGNVTPPPLPLALRERESSSLQASPQREWSYGPTIRQNKSEVDRFEARRSADLPYRPGMSASESTPALPAHSATADAAPAAPSGKLTADEEDPYVFRLDLDDASHKFELSLCFDNSFGQESNEEQDAYDFLENRVSFQRFLDDKEIINDERLVLKYQDRYLTWETASTVLATLSLYRKTLDAAEKQRSVSGGTGGDEDARARRSVWSRWWNRSTIRDEEGGGDDGPSTEGEKQKSSAPAQEMERSQSDSGVDKKASARDASKSQKTYAKTLRLTSDQLKSLNLKKGANTITFSVTSSYSGVATCAARIFFWDSNHRIVVSDIDGTITKSDALGHVFTMIGRDWTHLGVAKLYTDIARNGYRIMYLTSRAIGQADTTRDYLRGIKQNNYVLPDGPVIMSPDRLMASLHREVILRKPEVFKMACLRDIARLFGSDPRTAQAQSQPGGGSDENKSGNDGAPATDSSAANIATPFYAGFGNRITDALSYRSVNIPSSRIFTIDSNGEVKMELLELAGYKSSYIHMTDLVDQMFPPITQRESHPAKPQFNDFNYWRPVVAEFELPPDDELIPSPPTSPALSARSIRSIRSNESIRSTGSARSTGRSVTDPDAGSKGAGGQRDGEANAGRLSRFGLGSLGLSRRSSAQTVDVPPAASSNSSSGNGTRAAPPISSATVRRPGSTQSVLLPSTSGTASRPSSPEFDYGARRTSTDDGVGAGADASSPASYGSGVTSWTAPWRRRAVSPGAAASTAATSPLVGPVISADDEDSDEDVDVDDDVSDFGEDGTAGGLYDEGEVEFAPPGAKGRGRRAGVGEVEGEGKNEDNMGDDVLDDDEQEEDEEDDVDDPLLATGEINFEWRG